MDLGVPYEKRVVSAHRTPRLMFEYASTAAERGLRVLIAGAGGAAHLPGMSASLTQLPVLGVPVEGAALKGLDSLCSIVQMPAGIPVATFAIGKPGAINAGLFAASLLAHEPPGNRAGAPGPAQGADAQGAWRPAAVIAPGRAIGVLGGEARWAGCFRTRRRTWATGSMCLSLMSLPGGQGGGPRDLCVFTTTSRPWRRLRGPWTS